MSATPSPNRRVRRLTVTRHRPDVRRRRADPDADRLRLPDRQAPRRGRHPDAPRRRLARPGDARLRERAQRDDGRHAPPRRGGHARRAARARRRRHAVPVYATPEDALRNAGRFIHDAARPGGQGRGRRPQRPDHRDARQGRHPGHGPHRADAAVGERDRQVPGPGQDPRAGPGAPPRRARGPGGGRVLGRPRARSGAARRRDHGAAPDPDDRDRRRGRLQRPGPDHHRPARPRHLASEARQAVRGPARDDPRRGPGVRRTRSSPARSPGPSRPSGWTTTCSTRSSAASRPTPPTRPACRSAGSRSTATSRRPPPLRRAGRAAHVVWPSVRGLRRTPTRVRAVTLPAPPSSARLDLEPNGQAVRREVRRS